MNNPNTFVERVNQDAIWAQKTISFSTFIEQVLVAIRVFVDRSDPNWRHNIVGQSGFNWFDFIGFWIAFFVTCYNIRRPHYLFIWIGLICLWLPALLSQPSPHVLRSLGMLPYYYIFVAIGLIKVLLLITNFLLRMEKSSWIIGASFILFVWGNGVSTAFDYFLRWANEPKVYQQYEGPLTDLTNQIIEFKDTSDFLLPLTIYEIPTTRFLLRQKFQEVDILPKYKAERPVFIIESDFALSNRLGTKRNSTYTWLTFNADGHGVAYSSRHSRMIETSDLITLPSEKILIKHYFTEDIVAELIPLNNSEQIVSLLSGIPLQPIDYSWDSQIYLTDYQIFPRYIQPGQTLVVYLNWKNLANSPWAYEVTLDLMNSLGQTIDQQKVDYQKFFSWRTNMGIHVEHKFFIGSEVTPGSYLLNIGLKNKRYDRLLTDRNKIDGDQLALTVFYVVPENIDLYQPDQTLSVLLNNQIELVGYAPPEPLSERLFRGKLYWKAKSQLNKDYTPFVKLVDERGQIVLEWSETPFNGLYPSSLWKPDEVVVSEFDLLFANNLPAGQYELITGMYDITTGQVVTIKDNHHTQTLPENTILLTTINVP